HADIRNSVEPRLMEQERAYQKQLNTKVEQQVKVLSSNHTKEQEDAAESEIEKLVEELQKIEAQIRKDNPHYAALRYPQPLNLSEIQQVLDHNTLLLEYALGSERSYLWAVTTDSITSYELPKREEIER